MTRRVLLVRQDNLGDVLLCGPAIRAVAGSGAEVTLLCGPRGRAAAELLPGVSDVLEWRADWIDPEPRPLERARVERFVRMVEGRGFDEALVFASHHQSPLPLALLLRMAGVRMIGAISEDYAGSLLDVRHRVPDDIHEVERALSLTAACGYELSPGGEACGDGLLPDGEACGDGLPPSGEAGRDGEARLELARVRLRLREVGPPHPAAQALRPYVVVHPGASVSARAWPAGRHAELVELLVREGHNVVVTGSPSERALTAAVSGVGDASGGLSGAPGGRLTGAPGSSPTSGRAGSRVVVPVRRPVVLDLGGATSLAQLAATIAGARALVVGNSGPAHIAAAVGTPVVSLYAPTVPAVRWRPWGVPFRLLQREVPCAGCRARECPVPNHPCMSGITAEEALHALRELLGEPHGIPHASHSPAAHSQPAAPVAQPAEPAAEAAAEPAAEPAVEPAAEPAVEDETGRLEGRPQEALA